MFYRLIIIGSLLKVASLTLLTWCFFSYFRVNLIEFYQTNAETADVVNIDFCN